MAAAGVAFVPAAPDLLELELGARGARFALTLGLLVGRACGESTRTISSDKVTGLGCFGGRTMGVSGILDGPAIAKGDDIVYCLEMMGGVMPTLSCGIRARKSEYGRKIRARAAVDANMERLRYPVCDMSKDSFRVNMHDAS